MHQPRKSIGSKEGQGQEGQGGLQGKGKNRTKDQKTEQKLDDQKGGKVQRPLDTLMAVIWRYPVLLPLPYMDGEKLAVSVSA